MGLYNPHTPRVVGNEWYVTHEYGVPLDTEATGAAMRLTAQAGPSVEYIDQASIYLADYTDAGTGTWMCQLNIIDSPTFDDALLNGIDALTFNPPTASLGGGELNIPVFSRTHNNRSTNGVGCLHISPAGDVARLDVTGTGDVDLFANVDDSISTWETHADFINFNADRSEYEWSASSLNTLRYLSGRKITSVKFGVFAKPGTAGTTLRPFIRRDGVKYKASAWQGTSRHGASDSVAQYYWFTWDTCPWTGLPWTPLDIEEFDEAEMATAGLTNRMGDGDGWAVYAMGLFVNFQDDYAEAVGFLSAPTLNAWNDFPLSTPVYRNLLANQESTFNDTVNPTGGWLAGLNTTIVRTTSKQWEGTASLRLTAIAAGDISASTTDGTGANAPGTMIPVTAGRFYYGSCYVSAGAVSAPAVVSLDWHGTDGSLIGTTQGSTVTVGTAPWVQLSVSGIAPEEAAQARLRVKFSSVAAGTNYFVDGCMITVNTPEVFFTEGGASRPWMVKRVGDDVFALFHKMPGGNGGPSVNILDSKVSPPMPPGSEVYCYVPQLRTPSGTFTSVGGPTSYAFGLKLRRTDLLYSTDGVAYAAMKSMPVYLNVKQQQQITIPQLAGYGFVRAVVSLASELTTDPLTITLRRAGVPVGASFVIQPSDLEGPRTQPQVVGAQSPDGIKTLELDQYYFEFTCPAATPDLGWNVNVLTTAGGQDAIGFGSTVDSFMTDFVEDDGSDAVITIAQLPAAPTGFTVSVI